MCDVGVINMKPVTILQPNKCKSCGWGEWTGTIQFCSKVKEACPREPKPEKVKT